MGRCFGQRFFTRGSIRPFRDGFIRISVDPGSVISPGRLARRSAVGMTRSRLRGRSELTSSTRRKLGYAAPSNHMLLTTAMRSLFIDFEQALDALPSLLGKIRPGKGRIIAIEAMRELLERIPEKTDLSGVSSTGDTREEVNLEGTLLGL